MASLNEIVQFGQYILTLKYEEFNEKIICKRRIYDCVDGRSLA